MDRSINIFLRLFLVATLLVVLLFATACEGITKEASSPTLEDHPTTSLPTQSLPAPGPFEIFITENGFIPAEITISTGDHLTWINKDSTWRAVGEAIPTGESAFEKPYGESGRLQPGESFAKTFVLPGIWVYWCPKTLQMGTVVIEIID